MASRALESRGPDRATAPADAEPATPRARRSAERRRQILDATAKTIAQHGYHNASLAQIAEEVGISAPSLLHHFANKEALLTELLAYRDQISLETAAALDPAHGQDFLDHLVETAQLNTERAGLTQLYAVLVAESLTDAHPATEYFRERFEGLGVMIRDAVAEVMADERVTSEDIAEVSRAIMAVMDGLQYQHLLAPSRVDMAPIVERTIRALLADLRARTQA